MKSTQIKSKRRQRRRNSVRSGIRKHSKLLRLSVNRTSKHISGQIIDDTQGRTLLAVSSTARSLADQLSGKTKTERAAFIGAEIAKKAKEAGVETVVLDRGHCKYHGRVKALADAVREGGLKF